MTKNNKALKTQPEANKKKRKVQLSSNKSKAKTDHKSQLSMRVWQSEIEALQRQKFSSVEEAARSIAEKVAARNLFQGEQAAKAISFIETVLTTDPVAQAYLKKALKISE
jgi:hypothetical protein